MTVAQALLSRADLHNRTGYLNARNALTGLFDAGVVPIANENDVVATEELRFGDNDRLSVLIAKLVGADRLYILSRTAGLYTANPESEPSAELIPDASDMPRAELERIAGGASQGGLGGMRSKLQAALEASADGIDVVIAGGDEPDVVVRLESGERVGTRFASPGSPPIQPRSVAQLQRGAARLHRRGRWRSSGSGQQRQQLASGWHYPGAGRFRARRSGKPDRRARKRIRARTRQLRVGRLVPDFWEAFNVHRRYPRNLKR